MATRETTVSLPELGLIASTRVMLGVGIGLLLGERLNSDQRKAAGWALLAVGAMTTLPLGFEVLGGRRVVEGEKREISKAA